MSYNLHAWYLDDGTIIGDTLQVAKALKIIQEDGVELGIHLNVCKTEVYWPSPDARCSTVGVFPPNISRPTDGVKLLGGPVSSHSKFCVDMVLSRVQKTITLMDAVVKHEDPQCELLLLRNCTGVSRLYFTMWTTRPCHLIEATKVFDTRLFQFVRHITTGDGPGYGLVQQRLSTLPMKHGGLGVYTMEDSKNYCFLASCLQSFLLQGHILKSSGLNNTWSSLASAIHDFNQVSGADFSFPSIDGVAPHHSMSHLATIYFDAVKKSTPTTFDMSERDMVLWHCNRVSHAQDYLMDIPIKGLNQKIGPRQFSAILRYRLGIPFFDEDDICPYCERKMDIFGDHALHCTSEVGLKFRHDIVRYTIADMCCRAGVPAIKEVALGLLADDGSALRPADILVYNWENGRDTCLDVTGVSPFTGGVRAFSPGQAIRGAIARKQAKYMEKCSAQGLGFDNLTFPTLGELGSVTIEFLKRLMASHDANVTVGNFFPHRIGVVIPKGVGAHFVARLPTNFLKKPEKEGVPKYYQLFVLARESYGKVWTISKINIQTSNWSNLNS